MAGGERNTTAATVHSPAGWLGRWRTPRAPLNGASESDQRNDCVAFSGRHSLFGGWRRGAKSAHSRKVARNRRAADRCVRRSDIDATRNPHRNRNSRTFTRQFSFIWARRKGRGNLDENGGLRFYFGEKKTRSRLDQLIGKGHGKGRWMRLTRDA